MGRTRLGVSGGGSGWAGRSGHVADPGVGGRGTRTGCRWRRWHGVPPTVTRSRCSRWATTSIWRGRVGAGVGGGAGAWFDLGGHGELDPFYYAPDAGFSGTDVVTYVIRDDHGLLGQGIVAVGVRTTGNQPPVAQSAHHVVEPGATHTFRLGAVDPEGAALTWRLVTAPAGTLTGELSGSSPELTYTAPTDRRSDALVFEVSDGTLTAQATVQFTIPRPNVDPVAHDDGTTTQQEVPVDVDVLANDTDGDGDEPRVTNWSQGAIGTVACSSATCTYTPNPGSRASTRSRTRSSTASAAPPPARCTSRSSRRRSSRRCARTRRRPARAPRRSASATSPTSGCASSRWTSPTHRSLAAPRSPGAPRSLAGPVRPPRPARRLRAVRPPGADRPRRPTLRDPRRLPRRMAGAARRDRARRPPDAGHRVR